METCHTIFKKSLTKKRANIFLKAFLLIVPLFFSLFLCAKDEESLLPDGASFLIQDTRFEVGYVTGDFIGLKEDYLELGAFAPAFSCDDLFTFLDVKGYRFENSKWGASAGVGLRYSCCDYIVGSNVYYDFLQGYYHNFNRMGAGFELLGNCWDLRINGYFPVLKTEQHSRTRIFSDFCTNFCSISKKWQRSPRLGFDMELGVPIGCWNQFSSYVAIGPYYYNWRHKKNYWGGQARLEINWRSFVSLQVQTSYDRVNHSRTEGKFLFFFPLDVLCGDWMCDDPCKVLLYQPVVRNGTIFTDRCCDCCRNW